MSPRKIRVAHFQMFGRFPMNVVLRVGGRRVLKIFFSEFFMSENIFGFFKINN